MFQYDNYIQYRNIGEAYYEDVRLPAYFLEFFHQTKNMLHIRHRLRFWADTVGLNKSRPTGIWGVDISSETVNFCKQRDLNVTQIADLRNFCAESAKDTIS